MSIAALLLAAVVYIPLFGQLSKAVRESHTAVSYALLLFLFSVIFLKSLGQRLKVGGAWIFVFVSVSFVLIGLLHFDVGGGGLVGFLYAHHGYVLSAAIVLYVATFGEQDQERLLHGVVAIVAVAFLAQFVLSAFESYHGTYLAQDAEWLNEREFVDVLRDRFIGNVISADLGRVLFLDLFTFPFTGVLGQHNYWGTQLPFYNLLFLFHYHKQNDRRYLVFVPLVLAAAVLNTSRFGIAAIVFTDVAFFMFLTKIPVRDQRLAKCMLVLPIVGVLVIVLGAVVRGWLGYFATQDTLTRRVHDYWLLAGAFWQQGEAAAFFGRSISGLRETSISVLGRVASFESQLFLTLYYYGVVGVGLVTVAGAIVVRQFVKLPGVWAWAGALLIMNVVTVSLISNLVFHYSSYSIVTLCYLYARLEGDRAAIRDGYA